MRDALEGLLTGAAGGLAVVVLGGLGLVLVLALINVVARLVGVVLP